VKPDGEFRNFFSSDRLEPHAHADQAGSTAILAANSLHQKSQLFVASFVLVGPHRHFPDRESLLAAV